VIEQPRAVGGESAGLWRRVLDFVELGKPRLALMVLITTAAGFYLGSRAGAELLLLLPTLIGTGLAASGALALNQYLERGVDGQMNRTRQRPLPDGRLAAHEALLFGSFISVLGLAYLGLAVNWLCAAVTAFTTLSYLFAYTPLKTRTPLCTIVGAIPGALPPVTGWAAARGSIGIEAAVLFAILFLWQLPHSLAIARLYRDDYARGGILLLPVVEPDTRSTGRQVLSNTAALFLVALLPSAVGLAGRLYFGAALVFGSLFLWTALRFALRRDEHSARTVLFASLLYLPALLIVMTLDKAPPIAGY
jgi:protoheme IX farnesyltransferase